MASESKKTIHDVLAEAKKNARDVGTPMKLKLSSTCKSCGKGMKRYQVEVANGEKSKHVFTDTCQSCGEIWQRTFEVLPLGGNHDVGYMTMIDFKFIDRAEPNCPGCGELGVGLVQTDAGTKTICQVCDGTGWASPKNRKLFKAGKLDIIEGLVDHDG